MLDAVFDAANWARVPFEFWALVCFVFGCCVGSFLNVCIYRLPRGLSLVSPPSHCPHCHYAIPWWLNVPLVTWLWLRGRCRNCGAPISPRYFAVELLTGLAFLACWLAFGRDSVGLALVYAVFLSGLVAATFIDLEHFIIPDEITLGGMAVGFLASFFLPELHGASTLTEGMKRSLVGMAVGAGVVYAVLRLGKLLFGRQRLNLSSGTKLVFGETALHLPDREIPYEEIFYRASDTIRLHAERVELIDRCYRSVPVRVALLARRLEIGEEQLDPESCPHMEVVASEIVLPREAMGLGDVKFMAAIGAFLGWRAVIFALMVSSLIGAAVGLTLIALRRREWSSRLPFGPYIALAAALWIFGGNRLAEAFLP